MVINSLKINEKNIFSFENKKYLKNHRFKTFLRPQLNCRRNYSRYKYFDVPLQPHIYHIYHT